MEPQNTKEDLQKIGEALPHGAFKRIADECEVTAAYVGQFFAGKHDITAANVKLLDSANKILDEEKAAQKSAEEKINEMLSKGKE